MRGASFEAASSRGSGKNACVHSGLPVFEMLNDQVWKKLPRPHIFEWIKQRKGILTPEMMDLR
jgi:hypothetical protein